ncbi:MAG TPA: ROK family transcriptional regulator [Anaerovoracaceae bacterium]|nr:ROK family transcriptional regulator [Anaerovoracaceae bacterium]
MNASSNNMEVRKANKNRAFRYICQKERVSKPEIAAALGISVPTVLQLVNKLEEENLVFEVGECDSKGGRKAKAVGPNWGAAYAIGLDITKNHIGLIYTNLSKQVLEHIRIYKSFTGTEEYYKEVTDTLKDFIQEYHIPEDKIVGVGISIPGIVDGDHNRIERSHVLNLYDVPCERFEKYLPYSTILINDANAAGRTEIDSDRSKNNIVYLSLSNSVGGSVIMGDIYSGNNWRSGEFGHMTVAEEEGTCYCGKKGCFDVCCSALRLAELADGKLEIFFEGLEQQNEEYKKAWEKYLSYLATMVGNLHMVFDCDIILGGYVGSFMGPYIREFQERIARDNIFGNTGSYVKSCKYQLEAAALGAALFFIEKYMKEI